MTSDGAEVDPTVEPVQCADGGLNDEDDEEPAVNPAPPRDAEWEVLRSDAIGDTMYSQRGVLRILIALNQAVPRYLGIAAQDGDGKPSAEVGAGGDHAATDDGGGEIELRPSKRTENGEPVGGEELTDFSQVAGLETAQRKDLPADHSVSEEPVQTVVKGAVDSAAADSSSSDAVSPEPRVSADSTLPGASPAGAAATAAGASLASPAAGALLELEPELEQQLCQLWDMSAERDVAAYLHAAGLLQVVWPLLGRSPCPRLLEIVAGILANCLSHRTAFPLSAPLLVEAVDLLIGNSRDDAPLLAETLRLATAAVCGGVAGRQQLGAAARRWLPLLQRILAAALSPQLLHHALALVSALTETAADSAAWLAAMAALDGWTPALLEALRQLTTSPGDVAAADLLSTCRDTLRLTAELAPAAAAAPPGALQCVRAVARGCRPDARVAGYLLWLAARALRVQFCGAALADTLRYCRAVLDGRRRLPPPPPLAGSGDWSARVAATPLMSTPAHGPGGADTSQPAAGTPVPAPPGAVVGDRTPGVAADVPSAASSPAAAAVADGKDDDEDDAEARLELEARLSSTMVLLGSTCDALPHFLSTVEPALAHFCRTVLRRDAAEPPQPPSPRRPAPTRPVSEGS